MDHKFRSCGSSHGNPSFSKTSRSDLHGTLTVDFTCTEHPKTQTRVLDPVQVINPGCIFLNPPHDLTLPSNASLWFASVEGWCRGLICRVDEEIRTNCTSLGSGYTPHVLSQNLCEMMCFAADWGTYSVSMRVANHWVQSMVVKLVAISFCQQPQPVPAGILIFWLKLLQMSFSTQKHRISNTALQLSLLEWHLFDVRNFNTVTVSCLVLKK